MFGALNGNVSFNPCKPCKIVVSSPIYSLWKNFLKVMLLVSAKLGFKPVSSMSCTTVSVQIVRADAS